MNYKRALWLTWALLAAGAGGFALAQRGPDSLPGCIYNASPPTLTDGQASPLQCDVSGRLKTTAS